jgi:transcription elongation factor Elf1
MKYICSVCGYPNLDEHPYDSQGNPSYIICDCCGFEFGFDDKSKGRSFDEYRKEWIAQGAKWFNPTKKPNNWNLDGQLTNIE